MSLTDLGVTVLCTKQVDPPPGGPFLGTTSGELDTVVKAGTQPRVPPVPGPRPGVTIRRSLDGTFHDAPVQLPPATVSVNRPDPLTQVQPPSERSSRVESLSRRKISVLQPLESSTSVPGYPPDVVDEGPLSLLEEEGSTSTVASVLLRLTFVSGSLEVSVLVTPRLGPDPLSSPGRL